MPGQGDQARFRGYQRAANGRLAPMRVGGVNQESVNSELCAAQGVAKPASQSEAIMSGYDLTREYLAPIELVWRSLTEADLVAAWTVTGRGGQPVGFQPIVGAKFQFIGKPTPGWNGVVDCEVLEVQRPTRLCYTWRGGADDDVTTVSCTLETTAAGTRLRWQHTGFTGIGGFIVSRILSSVRKKMLDAGLPPLLDQLAKQAHT